MQLPGNPLRRFCSQQLRSSKVRCSMLLSKRMRPWRSCTATRTGCRLTAVFVGISGSSFAEQQYWERRGASLAATGLHAMVQRHSTPLASSSFAGAKTHNRKTTHLSCTRFRDGLVEFFIRHFPELLAIPRLWQKTGEASPL